MKSTTIVAILGVLLVLAGIALGVNRWLAGTDPVVASSPVSATEEIPPEAPAIAPQGPYPKAVFLEEEYDFGVMPVNTEESHTFVVRNEGEAPLKIHLGKTTCKCTLSELAKDEIPPGESAEITLSWLPPNKQPDFSQQATIWTNDPNKQKNFLSIRGVVEGYLDLYPESPWDIGTVGLDEEFTLQGDIFSKVMKDLDITGHEISNPDIQVRWEKIPEGELAQRQALSGFRISIVGSLKQTPSEELPNGESVKISALGSHQEKLTLKTNQKEQPEIEINLTGRVKGPLDVRLLSKGQWSGSRMTFFFGTVDRQVGANASFSVDFSDLTDRESFQIQEVRTDPEFLKVEFQEDEDFLSSSQRRFKMTMELPPDLPPANRNKDNPAVITIKTNHPHPLLKEFKILAIFTAG